MELLKFLKFKGISQTKLAQELGVTPSNVNLWVNGKGYPSYDMCRKLLSMGMSVDDLFDIDYESIQSREGSLNRISEDEFMRRFRECMAEYNKNKP